MKYIGSHMTVIKVEYDELARPTFFFKDGTALQQMNSSVRNPDTNTSNTNMRDWTFYTTYPGKCIALYGSEVNARGKCSFPFLYAPEGIPGYINNAWAYKFHINKGMEPYKNEWDGNLQTLKNKCRGTNPEYCTAWIQMNGWKIPDDYPFKVAY